MKDLAITSDGEVFENKKYLGRNLSRLRIDNGNYNVAKKVQTDVRSKEWS